MRFERILSLDIALKTGWAFRDISKDQLVSSHVQFDSGPRQDGRTLFQFQAWLRSKIFHYQPELISFEQPHLRGANTFRLVSMAGLVEMACHEHNIVFTSIAAKSVQKFAFEGKQTEWLFKAEQRIAEQKIPKSRAYPSKVAMMMVAETFGLNVRTDDEADALMQSVFVRDLMESDPKWNPADPVKSKAKRENLKRKRALKLAQSL